MAHAILVLTGLALAKGSVAQLAEGQAAVMELAEEVKAWKVEKLPIPFEIEHNSDVAYLGKLPINKTWKAESKILSLETWREGEGMKPGIVIARALMTGSGTPTIPPPSSRSLGPAAGGQQKVHLNGAVNPTAELTIMGWQRNTYEALKDEMDAWKARNRRAEKTMILHSSGDTLFGGCTEAQIDAKYNAIIAAAAAAGSPATIVAAAEVSPSPVDMGMKYSMPKYSWTETRRTTTLSNLSIADGWASTYASCTGSPCDRANKYRYAHAGFIMGPLEDLLAMFEGMDLTTTSMQRFINDYYLKNPDKMTLDYGGILAMTLNDMNNAGGPVLVASAGNTTLMPKAGVGVPGIPICFVQGNGNGFGELKKLAETITGNLTV